MNVTSFVSSNYSISFSHSARHCPLCLIVCGGTSQIERHWSLYAVQELTLDKLQLIATANATPSHKVKWLTWLNSSAPTREARRFPPRPANDDKITSFLSKACWYAAVSSISSPFREDFHRLDHSCLFQMLLVY